MFTYSLYRLFAVSATLLLTQFVRGEVLSNNLSQTPTQTYAVSGNTQVAAAFKTEAVAYSLDSVILLLANPSPGQATLSLYSDIGGKPGVVLGTLAPPAAYSSSPSAVTFTASGLTLSPSTNYWLVLRAGSGSFEWSWSDNNNGAGSGFLHLYATNSGSGWFPFSLNQPLMLVSATSLAATCSFNLNPSKTTAPVGGGAGSIALTANPGCNSTVTSNAPWIAVNSSAMTSGNATINYTTQANGTGDARVGTIMAGDQAFLINQPGVQCNLSVSPTTLILPPGGGSVPLSVTTGPGCPYTVLSNSPAVTVTSGQTGSGSGTVTISAAANTGSTLNTTLNVSGRTVAVVQGSNVCAITTNPSAFTFDAVGGPGTINLTTGAGCSWSITSNAPWLNITSSPVGTGNGSVTFTAAANTGVTRFGSFTLNGQNINVTQLSNGCSLTLSATSQTFTSTGGPGTVGVTTQPGCPFTAISNSAFITIVGGGGGTGSGTVSYSVQQNTGAQRSGTITIGGVTFTVTQTSTAAIPLRFLPVTQCRIADTRKTAGPFGGPRVNPGETRSYNVTGSACNIPTTAVAYAVQLTVYPIAGLGYATLWPTGQPQPFVSTLNSFDGRPRTNSAIVTAGTGGAVSVFVTDLTHITLDISGYFVPASIGTGLTFFPVPPCRISDTRNAPGPYGGPFLTANQYRVITLPGVCGIPSTAQVFSVNITTLSKGAAGEMTAWPTGQPQPNVTTPTSVSGTTTANAEIISAGTAGSFNVNTSTDSDVIVDVNGYFAPPALGGLNFYTLAPCRLLDTRNAPGMFGGPILAGAASRTIPAASSPCGVPSFAQAYSLNATAVPNPGSALSFLTLYPSGQTQPLVSTLNSFEGAVVANAAIVPGGTSGSINAFVTQNANLVLDLNGYFAP